jgi:RHS repeat-associated protein
VSGTNGNESFTYDGNQNMTFDGVNTLTYDVENRLVQAQNAAWGTSTYLYDPLGRRKQKQVVDGAYTVTTQFVLAGGQEIADYNGTGVGTAWVLTVRGAGGLPVASITPSASGSATVAAYYHHDVMGSTVAATEPGYSGAAMVFNYSDFGVPGAGSGLSYTYAGYRYDSETGLYYVNARYYNPNLGRFLQTDPIGLQGGRNLYAYTNNDPLGLVDRTGLCPDGLPGQGESSSQVPTTSLYIVTFQGYNHDVGGGFMAAAQTAAYQNTLNGNNSIVVYASTVEQMNTALTSNGIIDGGVTIYGHGGGYIADNSGNPYSALFLSSGNPLTSQNVNQLSADNLGPNVTITINACNAGGTDYGTPIAQSLANQLNVNVSAYNSNMFLSNDPNANNSSQVPNAVGNQPVYMLPEHAVPPTTFCPGGCSQ